MDAKDTVMSDDKEAQVLLDIARQGLSAGHNQYQIERAQVQARRLTQAEISFKEGEQENCIGHYEDGKRAGRREVVEWVNENVGYDGMTTLDEKWRAQKKDWGIKDERA